jgi:hypothetical protein
MILFVNSTGVCYEDDNITRLFTDGQNCTLLITSYFPNYIYEMEPYILANNNNTRRKEQKRKKRKKNERKLLKD